MLTDAKIKAARPLEKPYKLADGGGLTLIVRPDGARWWRFRYRWMGNENMLSLGTYPDVPLKLARERRDAARRDVAAGIDPSAKRQAEKLARVDTFGAVATEWLAKQSYSERTLSKCRWILDTLLYPDLGKLPLRSIEPRTVLDVLEGIEARGHRESAHRARQKVGQIMRYGVATGRCDRDPTADLKGALAPVQTVSRAAIVNPAALGQLLRAIDAYQGSYVVRQYLRILPHVLTRPGELRLARWDWIEGDTLDIPAEVMKMRTAHLVPLSKQVLAMLDELRALTGRGEYLFPGRSGRTMSDATPSVSLKALGYSSDVHTCHGFRSSASTMLRERLRFDSAWIESQLAHVVPGVAGIYDRSQYIDDRRDMLQRWSDYLDELCASTQA